MNPSDWKAPEPTTVSSAILFHCATVFPGGSAAAAVCVVPAPEAPTSAAVTPAAQRTVVLRRFMTLDLPRVAEAWFPPTTAKSRPLGDWSRYDDRRIFGAVPALARGDAESLLRFVAEAESFGGDHPFSGEFLTQLGRLV